MDQRLVEKFAAGIAAGLDPGSAYVQAGFPGPCGRKATEAADMLLLDADIKEQIAEACAKVPSAAEYTKSDILRECMENLRAAKAAGNHAAANRAIELLGKEKGMFIDRKDVRFSRKLSDLSDEELEELVKGD